MSRLGAVLAEIEAEEAEGFALTSDEYGDDAVLCPNPECDLYRQEIEPEFDRFSRGKTIFVCPICGVDVEVRE